MESEIVWITPLLLAPGIATLIISTSSRYAALHEELHRWLEGADDAQFIGHARLMQRAVHFRNALVAQYLAVFILVLASVCGVTLQALNAAGDTAVVVIMVVGITVVGYSVIELIRESRLSLAVIRAHLERGTPYPAAPPPAPRPPRRGPGRTSG